jgi:hypothetical protein
MRGMELAWVLHAKLSVVFGSQRLPTVISKPVAKIHSGYVHLVKFLPTGGS